MTNGVKCSILDKTEVYSLVKAKFGLENIL